MSLRRPARPSGDEARVVRRQHAPAPRPRRPGGREDRLARGHRGHSPGHRQAPGLRRRGGGRTRPRAPGERASTGPLGGHPPGAVPARGRRRTLDRLLRTARVRTGRQLRPRGPVWASLRCQAARLMVAEAEAPINPTNRRSSSTCTRTTWPAFAATLSPTASRRASSLTAYRDRATRCASTDPDGYCLMLAQIDDETIIGR
jgi:hypothetical protein